MFRFIYDKYFGGTVAGKGMTNRSANYPADVERPLQKLMKLLGLVGRRWLASITSKTISGPAKASRGFARCARNGVYRMNIPIRPRWSPGRNVYLAKLRHESFEIALMIRARYGATMSRAPNLIRPLRRLRWRLQADANYPNRFRARELCLSGRIVSREIAPS